MPCPISVEWGLSFGDESREESEVSCSGVPQGDGICELMMHQTSSVTITDPGHDDFLPAALGSQSWHTSSEQVC